jgi:hypothetical protein
MKRNISTAIVATTPFTLLSVGFLPAAQAQGCSLDQTAGRWAFSTNGNVIGIGPRVSAGILTFNAVGNVLHGKATSSLNGTVAPELFSGTYSVKPDCTGEMQANVLDTSGNKLFTATLALYFDDGAKELRGIFTSVVAPNGAGLYSAIVVDGRKIGDE